MSTCRVIERLETLNVNLALDNELRMIKLAPFSLCGEFSLPQDREDTDALSYSLPYWVPPHRRAFPQTSEAVNTESIKRPQSDLALTPVVLIWTPLKLLWIQYELKVEFSFSKERLCQNLEPSRWFILYISPVEFVYLKVWSQYFELEFFNHSISICLSVCLV